MNQQGCVRVCLMVGLAVPSDASGRWRLMQWKLGGMKASCVTAVATGAAAVAPAEGGAHLGAECVSGFCGFCHCDARGCDVLLVGFG